MQLSDMRGRVSARLNEAGAPTFYPAGELTAALNEGQRFFCLLTLGLEQTATWTLLSATTFTHLLTVFSDLICVLRITDVSGNKVRPSSLADLASLNESWISSSGTPQRYVTLGADLVGLYPQASSNLTVTYARAPVALVLDTDVPEIPAEYHQHLVSYAIYRCRMVEGGQEFGKALKYLDEFLDGAKHYARYVRARNLGSKYDKTPWELDSFDRSKLINLRPDLMPATEIPQDSGTALPEAA